ncbi:MAG: PQQ-dependent sugar dehydrogenase, partial [Planctomycetota bacterium]|nr:PQQ-dependent sugar dehydrogenase [Planctomycetota bacterium]
KEWEGYQAVDDKGRPQRIRPLQLMHAGDGSNRIFVASQAGMIHVFKNDRGVERADLFLDIRKRVHQWRVDDEEGLLGFAMHPKFKTTGQVFIYYNTIDKPRTIYLSRFTVAKDDPNKADPASEEILLTIKQPFANHNGGPMAFGPDGYLYIGMGDGGGRNDPENSGQAKNTFMGNILRIDVDHQDSGKKYAVPKDNPFVGEKGAFPEVYATGIRNTWRLSFDRKLGSLWIGDVGQDLWEEIHIIEKGGNYGWSVREGSYNFGNAPGASKVKVIDPVWEYDHQIGKSITGGYVYRGKRIPELDGHYLYADFITGKLWALHYDQQKRRVIRNVAIPWNGLPIVAFGEDEDGEIYVMTPTVSGNGIYKLLPEK